MKTRLTLLILLLPLCLMAQAPPVLRQALTTNTAPVNPSNVGQIPIWQGTFWSFGTNLPGLIVTNMPVADTNDFLWTNNTSGPIGFYHMTQTNSVVELDFAHPLNSVLFDINAANNQPNDLFRIIGGPASGNPIVVEVFGSGGTYLYSEDSTGVQLLYLDGSGLTIGGGDILEVRNSNNVSVARMNANGNLTLSRGLTINNAAGITNSGTYQHSVGAFTGALFVSSNANGVAYWTTNVNNIGVTNLSVYNNVIFNGSIISNFNRDVNWTNDGVVLKPTAFGRSPQNSFVFGGTVGTGAEALTNFAPMTFSVGSNVLNKGRSSSVLGGFTNVVNTNAIACVIGGGATNIINSNANWIVVGGGRENSVSSLSDASTIAGGWLGAITGGAQYATIGGGQQNDVASDNGTVSGGAANDIGAANAVSSTIGGGQNNLITDGAAYATVAGGRANQARGTGAAVGGGEGNLAGNTSVNVTYNTISGGLSNKIASLAGGTTEKSFIGGGQLNVIGPSTALFSVIAGGQQNAIDVGNYSTIAGGTSNIVTSAFAGQILGGIVNNVEGERGFIVGNSNRTTAIGSGALGQQLTNTLAGSVDIGNLDSRKTTFHNASNYFRAPVVIGVGGALITNVLTASAALTFTAVAAQTSQDQVVSVPGTTTNDVVTLGIPFHVQQGAGAINCNFSAFTSNDNVWVRMNNYSSATRSTNGVFKVMVTRF